MQWRVLLRRGPLKSFTIVGDVAQASAAASTTDWATTLAPLFGESWRLEELTVNYRTPSQIVEAAERVAEAAGLAVTRSRSVRTTEWPVDVIRARGPLAEAVRETVDAVRGEGTTAVIVPEAAVDSVAAALAERFGDAVGRGAAGLTRPVAVLSAAEAKGLEFDVVVVGAPAAIRAESTRGASSLYVAMTRPTQRLSLVLDDGEAPPAGL